MSRARTFLLLWIMAIGLFTLTIWQLLEATIGAHGEGRRRATLHARGGRVGYMAARSHDLVEILACPILVPPLQERAPGLARPIAATIGDCDVAFTATDTGLDVAVRTERRLKPEKLTLLAQRSGARALDDLGAIRVNRSSKSVEIRAAAPGEVSFLDTWRTRRG